MIADLKFKAFNAFGWRAVERYSVQGIQFILGVIIARILTPHDYGLIALVLVFTSVGQVLIEGGLGDALVQRKEVDHTCACTAFFCSVAIGVCCAGLLCIASPLIAVFYEEPQLRRIIPALSLNLIFSSFAVVSNALLVKRLEFKNLAKTNLLASCVSGTVGVTMALNGFGVWSLVGQPLANQAARLIGLWKFSQWRPSFEFEWRAVKSVAQFGSRVLAANLSEILFINLYVVVIGKLFTPTTLGFYARADSFWNITMSNFAAVVSSVALPVMSSIKDNQKRLRNALARAVQMLAFVSYPASVGLACIARPLILTLLTNKWEPCVPFVQLLCGVWFLFPLHAINCSVLLAQGQSGLYLRIQLIKKVIMLVILVITLPFGIYFLIVGQIVNSLIAYYVNCFYSGKLLGYGMMEQLKDTLPYMGCALLMGGVLQMISYSNLAQPALLLALQLSVGLILYISLCALFKLPAISNALEFIRHRKGARHESVLVGVGDAPE